MTDSVSLLTLSLCKWLQDPKIRIESSSAEEIAALQMQVQSLQAELSKAKQENQILMGRYSGELNLNFMLQDLLKANNIKWR